MRINQQQVLPTAVKNRHYGDDILVTGLGFLGAAIASGHGHTFTAISEVLPSQQVFSIPDITLFQDSIAFNNEIPFGSNVNPSDYQIIGPWNNLALSDGNNVASSIYVGNVSTTSGSIQEQVGASNNDGGITSAGTWNFTNSNFLIGRSATPNDFTIGVRFINVTIPQGATISNATIALTAQTTKSATVSVKVYGINQDNTANFSTDPTGRPRTTANVTWNLTAETLNVAVFTPDISSVIQEIVNRSGWASGNAMGFLIPNNTSADNNFLSYYTYDGDTSRAAILSLDYIAGGSTKNVIFAVQSKGIVANPNLIGS